MNRLLWTVRRIDARTDHAVLTAIALVVLGMILYGLAISPRANRLAAVEADLALQSGQLRVLQRRQVVVPQQARDIPLVSTLPAVTRHLQDIARQRGVVVSHVNYRLERDGALYRYRMSTEIGSSYRDVRRFVHEAMRQYPALSLDRLEIEQGDAAGSAPRTTVELSVYFRDQSGSDIQASVEAEK